MINFLDSDILLTSYSCAGTKVFPIFQMAKFLIVLVQIAVPFALIIWGSLDFFKALIAHDEKEMRMKRKPFFTRVIVAMVVLILPWIVEIVADTFAVKESSTVTSCSEYTKDGETVCNNSETLTYTCQWVKQYKKCAEKKKKPTSCAEYTKDGETVCNNSETLTYTCQWVKQYNRCAEKANKELTKDPNKNTFWQCYSEAKPRIDFTQWQESTETPKNIKILGGSEKSSK